MSYNADMIAEARTVIDRRRANAEAEAEAHKTEFFTAHPEARELKEKMRSTARDVGKIIASGENVKERIAELREENLKASAELRKLLSENGLPEDYLEPRYTCPVCSDTGTAGGFFCDCIKKLLRNLAYKELSESTSLKCTSFADFDLSFYASDAKVYSDMSRVFEYCRAYAENFDLRSDNLLMMGATGLGKTHLSLAIAAAAIDKGYGVVYGTVQRLFSQIEREHFGRSDRRDGETEDKLLGCDLLILDDLGAEFGTSFVTAELNNIIDSRLSEGRPTIISTNLTYDELQAKYSARLLSRIIGEYLILRFSGSDVRQQKRLRAQGAQ